MKITLVSASQRPLSKSLDVAHYLQQLAQAHFSGSTILDLQKINLPLWNEGGVWNNSEEWQQWNPIAEELKASDAFVFITPEWHGMATPALKNFFDVGDRRRVGA